MRTFIFSITLYLTINLSSGVQNEWGICGTFALSVFILAGAIMCFFQDFLEIMVRLEEIKP